MRKIGWRADADLVDRFDPHFLFWGGGSKPHASNHLVTACDSANDQIKALEKMDFIVSCHSIMTPTARYSDIILPAADWIWETKDFTRTASYGVFEAINANPGVVDAPGEAKQWLWIYIEICKRLGIDPSDFYRCYTGSRSWEEDWEEGMRKTYEKVETYYREKGCAVPSYEAFFEGEFINCDELADEPMTGFVSQLRDGKPFKTASGKLEFYYPLLEDETERGKGAHYTFDGRLIDNLPADWQDMPSSPVYKTCRKGMDDPMTREYPLMLLTSHSRYRIHYVHWVNPWLRNHVYRHRVWMNAVDAKKRGVKDNDPVLVYNDRGKVLMPAYVTNRIMPGVAMIHHGGNYEPDENGVDRGATPNTLMGGDTESNFTPARSTNLVQIEKYKGAEA
jgi:anaerobic dimethyl sulfoxide reductase subunit A